MRRYLPRPSTIPYALIASSTSFVCTFLFSFGLFFPATLLRLSRFSPSWSSPPCALDQCTSVDSRERPVCYILSVSPSALYPGTCAFVHTFVQHRPRVSITIFPDHRSFEQERYAIRPALLGATLDPDAQATDGSSGPTFPSHLAAWVPPDANHSRPRATFLLVVPWPL